MINGRWGGKGEKTEPEHPNLPVDDTVFVKVDEGGREFRCVEADRIFAECVVSQHMDWTRDRR